MKKKTDSIHELENQSFIIAKISCVSQNMSRKMNEAQPILSNRKIHCYFSIKHLK